MSLDTRPGRVALPGGLALRPATTDDLDDCARIWREGIDDYLRPMGFPEQPDSPGLRRLHAHSLATDPRGFWVAVRGGHGLAGGPERVIGFGSAMERGRLWFLSMLFIEPGEQGRGVGRAILDRILPEERDGWTLATATDSAQPISNGLYASLGIAPRMPMFHLIGRPERPEALPALPPGVRPEEIPDPGRWIRDDGEIADLDRQVLGYAHAQDHTFLVEQGRRLFGYRDAAGQLAGYGYASAVGLLGPIAVRAPELLAPVLGHLLLAVEPRGASAVWIPGHAGEALMALLRSGIHIDGFPTLMCWSRPFADFTRYVPTSPGIP